MKQYIFSALCLVSGAFCLSSCNDDKEARPYTPDYEIVPEYTNADTWKAYEAFNEHLLDQNKFIYKSSTADKAAVDRWNGAAAIWCQPTYWDMAMNAYKRAKAEGDTQKEQKFKQLCDDLFAGNKAHYANFDFDDNNENTGWFIYDDIMWWTVTLARAYELFGVEEYLDSIMVKRSSKEAFAALGNLVGGVEVLAKAKNIAPNSSGIMAVKRLEKIYDILELYGVEKFVTFDLSMTGNYGYYTGIIFRGYTFGTGDAVVKGGRYDHLLEKFGKTSASIGFAIVIDELMNALIRQKIRIVYTRKNAIILYDESRARDAIRLAKDFRAKAKNTELIKKSPEKGLEDYIRFGKEYYAGSLVYIKKSGEITMVNLVTGEQKEVNNNK